MRLDLTPLNAAQRAAVLHTEGPCLVIAGPGAGKTQVLTYRIAYLLTEKKVPAYQIMALTFTNKAAKQMGTRVENLVHTSAKQLWMGTFHSLFARILRVEASYLGFVSNFSIYDTQDSKSLIKTIVKELSLNDQVYAPKMVLSRISNAKNRLIPATQYAQDPSCKADDQAVGRPHMSQIFVQYQARCKQAQAMDFDDLLLHAYHLFTQYPDVREKYQKRFAYLLVDEYQDTNPLQAMLLKILAQDHKNLCVIGDDAQSIYAFRGADISNILDFKEQFPQAALFSLQQNYRSTGHIVKAAQSFIAHNPHQLKKDIFTTNAVGEPVTVHQVANNLEEASLVAKMIFKASHTHHLPYDHFAVLYRTNTQSRVLEEALRKNNIPYQIIAGMSFYQRKEVKDLLAYLSLIINPRDEQALYRVINNPKRGIGPATLTKLRELATQHNCSLWEILCEIQHFSKGAVAQAIQDFTQLIQQYIHLLPTKAPHDLASELAHQTGLIKALHQDKTPEGITRYENVQELLQAIEIFVAQAPQAQNTLAHFLQEVALVHNLDRAADADPTPQVTLMTMHAAKGLEFPYVYIVGLEETILPLSQMSFQPADIEEERRLLYVAITRAQTRLHLLHTKTRLRYGKLSLSRPSRFLNEIDPACLQVNNPVSSRPVSSPRAYLPKNASLKRLNSLAGPMSTTSLTLGKQVVHPQFGKGTIVAVDTPKNGPKLTIDFLKIGRKKILPQFTNLQISQ